MSFNTELDEILDKLVETVYNPTPQDEPFLMPQAKSAIIELVKRKVIGEDDDLAKFENNNFAYSVTFNKNRLRADQRNTLEEK